MTGIEIQVGSTITNGSSALRITERVEKDARWGTQGWRGICIALDRFGGNPGMSDFIPDYLARNWHHVPFEWTPLVGGGVEHRYVWSASWSYLVHEVRRMVQPTTDGIRGHLVFTEDEMAQRRLAERSIGRITAEQAARLLEA